VKDRHTRYAAWSGIGFVILVVLAFLVTPKPPASDASASEVLEYMVDHHSALHVVQLLFGAAVLLFIWFIGTLRATLGAAEGDQGRLAGTAYGGGLIAAAVLIVSFGLSATAALHPAENGPQVTHALNDAAALTLAVGAPAVAVFFLGNSLSILRSGFLAPWLAWLGFAAAVFNAVGISAVFTDRGVFAADGFLGFFLGFVLFLAWFLAASILLVRKLGDAGGAATPD
jgi:hypothetical protein